MLGVGGAGGGGGGGGGGQRCPLPYISLLGVPIFLEFATDSNCFLFV